MAIPTIVIGTDADAVNATITAIMSILHAHADQATLQVALKTLSDGIQPRNVVVSGCTFPMLGTDEDVAGPVL